jgi:hypothetical protein
MTSRPAPDDLGVPTFGRVEIALATRDDIIRAATHITTLAEVLTEIAINADPDDTARLLAYRKIRATSAKLRGAGK